MASWRLRSGPHGLGALLAFLALLAICPPGRPAGPVRAQGTADWEPTGLAEKVSGLILPPDGVGLFASTDRGLFRLRLQ